MSLIPDEMVGYGMFPDEMSDEQKVTQYYTNKVFTMADENEDETGTITISVDGMFKWPLQGWPADREFSTNMTDENDVRQADRVEEQAVVKRITDVISDLTAGKVGRSDRYNLGDALERANRNAGVQRAIR
jgi:hypothetical protein